MGRKRPPTVAGKAAVGSVLTGSGATWSDEPVPTTVARHWMRCNLAGGACAAIPGATNPTYTVTNADLGHTLRFRNIATDTDGTNFTQSRAARGLHPVRRPAATQVARRRATGHTRAFFARGSEQTRCDAPNAPPTVLNPFDNFLYDAYPVTSLLNEPVCLVVRTEAQLRQRRCHALDLQPGVRPGGRPRRELRGRTPGTHRSTSVSSRRPCPPAGGARSS